MPEPRAEESPSAASDGSVYPEYRIRRLLPERVNCPPD